MPPVKIQRLSSYTLTQWWFLQVGAFLRISKKGTDMVVVVPERLLWHWYSLRNKNCPLSSKQSCRKWTTFVQHVSLSVGPLAPRRVLSLRHTTALPFTGDLPSRGRFSIRSCHPPSYMELTPLIRWERCRELPLCSGIHHMVAKWIRCTLLTCFFKFKFCSRNDLFRLRFPPFVFLGTVISCAPIG